MKARLRKAGGYLILAGLLGGMVGAMIYDIGLVPALCILGGSVAVFGMLQLAVYLIWENR